MNRLGWWLMYGPWNIWNHPIVDENWIAIRCYQPQAHITSYNFRRIPGPVPPKKWGLWGPKWSSSRSSWRMLAPSQPRARPNRSPCPWSPSPIWVPLGRPSPPWWPEKAGWKAGWKNIGDTVETEELPGLRMGISCWLEWLLENKQWWGLSQMWDFLMSWAGHLRNTGNHFHRCQGTGGIISRTFRTTWILVMRSVREPPKIRLN